jgi:hypothetical protein
MEDAIRGLEDVHRGRGFTVSVNDWESTATEQGRPGGLA